MLGPFIVANRAAIIERARARVAARTFPKPSDVELKNGIPIFLNQLGAALLLAKSSKEIDHEQLSASAGRHGEELRRMGLTVAQVVRDYGDVCQVITQLAMEQNARIEPNEFQTLNLCLDDAVANAVTAYTHDHDLESANADTERLGVLAHEMRNLLNTAVLSYDIIKDGHVAVGGSTSLLLGRSLSGLRDLLDRSLADVRLDAGLKHVERISVSDFVQEIEIGALLQAQARGLRLDVPPLIAQ
ncbi:MAG: hypothetical protein ABI183_02005 [Polyangiaceae bacterium]